MDAFELAGVAGTLHGTKRRRPASLLRVIRLVGDSLPQGRTLPDAAWQRRHRAMLWLLWLHAIALTIYGALTGFGLLGSIGHGVPLVALALLATRAKSRKVCSVLVSGGLLTASALLVHLTHGLIESHFHFFVMIAIITLYEDWLPFLLAFLYVVLHHGVVGVLDPSGAFNHPDAQAHPWKWASIHGGFVIAAGAANVVAWRLNEGVRGELSHQNERLREAERLTHLGSWEWDMLTNEVTWSDEMYRIWNVDQEAFSPSLANFLETVHPDDRGFVEATVGRTREQGEPLEYEFRMLRPGGVVRTIYARGEVVVSDIGLPVRAVGTAQDITERKEIETERERLLAAEQAARVDAEKARAQLADQNEHLRELDRLKDEFVASVSHELRTPLTSIRGYLELVLEGEAGELSEEQRDCLGIVYRNSSGLLHVVGDLLDVAQFEAGRLSLDLQESDLGGVVAESVESARPVAAERGIDLRFEIDQSPTVEVDPARLAQVIDNLLSNALKFTETGGRVDVHVSALNGSAVVQVSDTGMGIAPDEQAQLFVRFFRGDAAGEKAVQGNGLGLWISKAIVEAHGGEIGVDSELGRGTTFRVELPSSKVPA
jgi:signal transduction histidine kinase